MSRAEFRHEAMATHCEIAIAGHPGAYAGQARSEVPDDLRAALEADDAARAFFETISGANRYAILYRLQEAKKPETRERRLHKFVAMLERGEKIH